MSKEEFRAIERKYNLWLSKHPKGDHNYKSFSHMRRSVEFAKAYADEVNKEIKELVNNCPELNNANYTEEQVLQLNDTMIQIHLLLNPFPTP